MFTQVAIITLLIIAAAYFAMSEIALAGARPVRLTRMAEKESAGSRAPSWL